MTDDPRSSRIHVRKSRSLRRDALPLRLIWFLLTVNLSIGAAGCMRMAPSAQDTAAVAEKSGGVSAAGLQRSDERFAAAEGESASDSSVELPRSERRIIYTATLDVAVGQFDGIEEKLEALVKESGGYIASVHLDRMQGRRRSGEWTVRIPVANYSGFLNAVGRLGVTTSRTEQAQDVTEEYIDLEARIANKRKLEARILQLLDRPDDKIQHVIEVERELARVREEIERMEGRLRYLADQTAMTTVTVRVHEELEYTPPESPSLAQRIRFAWTRSWLNVRQFVESLIVLLAGAIVPLAITGIGFLIVWKVIVRLLRPLRRRVTPNGESS